MRFLWVPGYSGVEEMRFLRVPGYSGVEVTVPCAVKSEVFRAVILTVLFHVMQWHVDWRDVTAVSGKVLPPFGTRASRKIPKILPDYKASHFKKQ
jgi:hypothetical protein